MTVQQQVGGSTASTASTDRRDFLRQVIGRANAASAEQPTPVQGPPAQSLQPAPVEWDDVRLRLLRRATYGPTPGDVLDVGNVGYQRWLNDQVNYTRIDDSDVEFQVAARWPLLSRTVGQLSQEEAYPLMLQLQESTIYRAAFSKRQLYERMVEFWSDHFNISIGKVGYLKVVDDREVIRKHAMGRVSDLVKASAHSPAMLAYLDQNYSRRGSPNQNYARELMELHTMGVDGGYTQEDVAELSRVLTGWTFAGAGVFAFNPSRHDYDAKTVLGVQIPATSQTTTGAAGVQEGEQIIDVLLNHPSTARFIATKMLKWLLTPEPTEVQIAAIAGAYRATRGDIKRMVRAILNEGWVAEAPAKLKRPFHLVVSGLRATNAQTTLLAQPNSWVRGIGQYLFQYETPEGYSDLVEYWVGNVPPRWSFGSTLSRATSQTNVNVNVAPYLAGTPDAAIDRINTEMFGGELAEATRATLRQFLTSGSFNDTRVRETIGLALSGYEFQWY